MKYLKEKYVSYLYGVVWDVARTKDFIEEKWIKELDDYATCPPVIIRAIKKAIRFLKGELSWAELYREERNFEDKKAEDDYAVIALLRCRRYWT